MKMTLALDSVQIDKVTKAIDAGEIILGRMEAERLALKDLADVLAEELQIKPALILKAIKLSYQQHQKDAIGEEQEKISVVETLLQAAGKI